MDELNVIDIVYSAIESSGTEIMVYKHKSEIGVTDDHIVITSPNCNEFRVYNKVPVYINILIKNFDNGMVNDTKIQEVKRAIRIQLDNLERFVRGKYLESDVLFSQPLGEVKSGFDGCTIRLDVSIQKF